MDKENSNELKIINKNERIKWLNIVAEKNQKITNLEAKLAESEKLKEDALYNYAWLNQDLSDTKEQLKVEKDAFKILSNNYNTLISAYDQLKQQLAESEKRIKDLEFRNKNLEHSLSVAPNANAGQRARIVELKEINHKLKQQLAEKDQAIESLQEINQSLGQTCNNDAKEIDKLTEQLILAKMGESFEQEKKNNALKSQNQTAIAELEKTKENMNNLYREHKPIYFDLLLIRNAIDQQISNLKGEK